MNSRPPTPIASFIFWALVVLGVIILSSWAAYGQPRPPRNTDTPSAADAPPLPLRVEAGHLWPTTPERETCIPLGKPLWTWEGFSSSVTVRHDDQAVTVAWHLDVRVALWWAIILTDDGDDLYAHFHDSCQQTPDWFCTWSTWDQLLSDPGDAAMVVRACFRRCGVNSKLEAVNR